jgi:hypothetical protein
MQRAKLNSCSSEQDKDFGFYEQNNKTSGSIGAENVLIDVSNNKLKMNLALWSDLVIKIRSYFVLAFLNYHYLFEEFTYKSGI